MGTPQRRIDVFKQSSISTEAAKVWSISVKEMQNNGFEFITCLDAWLKMSKKKADFTNEIFKHE